MIKVALNGSRNKIDHPNIPITTAELINSAKASIVAGANAIHFHVHDFEGNETLENSFVREQVNALKNALPGIPIGISTGEWIEPDIINRIGLIKKWEFIPDFVSVNGNEAGFDLVIRELIKKGIRIEAGISSVQAAKNLKDSNLLKHCFRILLEPEDQELTPALNHLESIEKILSDEFAGKSVLLHGYEATCWDLIYVAKKKGYDLRVGFEDTLTLPSGILANNNEELVRELVEITGGLKINF